MERSYFFENAKWVGAPASTEKSFWVLRSKFFADARRKGATLRVIGLGFFKCYINGVCINPDSFLPLSSDFEGGCDPAGEILSGHRIYVPSFDVNRFLVDGENTIAVHFGGGWYTFVEERCFGLPKAIYRLVIENADGTTHSFVSDEECRIGRGLVDDYCFTKREGQSYMGFRECFAPDFDDSAWEHAVAAKPLDTEYCLSDCPADALIETREVRKLCEGERGTIYDCGENTTGYPVLELSAAAGERVTVLFSEELASGGGLLDLAHAHDQAYTVLSDGERRTVQPEFTWFGFRYFEVVGNATPLCVKVVHANVSPASHFDCDNETLNWIYKTFMHTMLCNMHTGHPSDCPHIERRGYTGDGQLTCNAALTVFDAREFYEKWLQDIADSQDLATGHVQYTAPYIHSGGGPGGWGSAIVEVPYRLYEHFGDKAVLEKYYHNMQRYVDYLEAHSEFGLVTSDRAGEWCLGDWCGPNVLHPEADITNHNQQMLLPAPFVNTYFMVKSLRRLGEIAKIIGKGDDASKYEELARSREAAIRAAYFNAFDNNFIMNAQGANSFAVDLGLGNEKTYENLVSYYEKLGYFDTGIFATDVLCRVLFEHGDAELATKLITNAKGWGFERWRRSGATTFHEYWDSERSRSHSHPMFGAAVAYFFEYLLGIRQERGTVGYTSLHVEPSIVSAIGRLGGGIKTPHGDVAVEYRTEAGVRRFKVQIPHGVEAKFYMNGEAIPLKGGLNELSFPV